MKNIKIPGIFFLLVSFVFIEEKCFSQKPGLESDWEILFNGKDLSGWKDLNGDHKWEAKDGIIIGTFVSGQPNGFLCTEKEFSDFIFECEVSIDTLMNNSGIQFRSLCTPDYQEQRNKFPEGRVHGYQMEVDPKPQRWSGSIYEEGGNRAWLYVTSELNPASQKAFNKYHWNKYRIECSGSSIRTWVNGIPTSNIEDIKFPKGFIGLQLHANQPGDPEGAFQVRFRNLRIKTTNMNFSPPDEIFVVNMIPNNLSTQEKKNGYSLLWDGKSTNGWRATYKSEFPEKGWEIKDGELSVVNNFNQSSEINVSILTKKQYTAFELKFDFKLAEGANSGIKYFVIDKDENKGSAANSLEYQIVDDSKIEPSDVTRTLSSLADVLASNKTRGSSKKIGEWNQGIIRVLPSGLVEHWLNGYKVLEYQRGSVELAALIAKSKYKDVLGFSKAPKGSILLENNGSSISYRSIKIRELK